MNYEQLAQQIKIWGKELGFQKVGICDVDLSEHEAALQKWLDAGYHGSMDWMARHGMMRARPNELLPGTVRVISVRMDYLPPEAKFASNLANKNHAYISRYALGRDYHKLVRKQLNKLGKLIEQEVGQYGYRPFVDSAPILERPLAQKAGLGWTGKHSLILDKDCGSWFFLGELLIDLPLPVDEPSVDQCDKCKACITSCPTQAIVDEKVVDARRCISYLTIEFDGVIPEEFRKPMGNRIYGCDDCQLVCPWNRYADITEQEDFHRRDSFEDPDLVTMFNWDEPTFLKQMEGSAIRRIGHLQWLRNISVALGNTEYSQRTIDALEARRGESELLDEHINWALGQQLSQIPTAESDSIETKKKRLIRIVEKGLPRDA
ncbi:MULTISPECIES: tRNA epoxyqueuosine(34) reductase QueG [Vibrio]|jgi:epoxyqueuosine reductase|uniref:tRNA epoxyqueuosine(34) reductase QueG n=1 Tax=Vibrio TaxID=662 RepID=UPI000531635F|nr:MULTISPECIES: tRNA epoxyqueuosine(34) reductase QueG [Vibrio]KGR32762.1 iron-sulfur cluster-binding protein [Vibrio campbellii]MCC4226211.1 tRNA epoxyqueuosine(34) reductase QueG [Vibrio campbellii]NDJ83965.1 tRNA epoxyqueuosine(34) reductase QueG [Vibrio sp. LB10LO1]UMM03300.1 tRNA epoxyqueuosine(34) reductase QueG [Vibrio campbellii]CAD7815959.1 Catalyzes the conversion of epoxyqueuosine (oQ) to queuosine (Q) [Vibrio sp. B1FIG11]|tara:strand:+ start:49 stop:1176 length:1128 start_codon:yes stop_codon:yes gene_type:complete